MSQTTEASRARASRSNGSRHRLRVMFCAGGLALVLAGCQGGGMTNPVEEGQPSDAAPPEAPATMDPAVTSTGTGATTTTVNPWRDETFSTYSSDASWRSDPHDWMVTASSWMNQQAIHIDKSVTYDGHPTLRYDWPGATSSNTQCNSMLAREADYYLPTSREIWIEVVHKFASSFGTNQKGMGGLCGTTEYKYLLPRLKGVSFRIGEVKAGVRGFQWWGVHPSSVNQPLDNLNCSGIGWDCRLGYGTGQDAYRSSVPGSLFDGQWHVYRIHIKMPAYKGEASGILEFWIDGKLVKRVTNQTFIRGGLFSNQFASLGLGSNSNSGTTRATSNWWGRVRIWTTNPSW